MMLMKYQVFGILALGALLLAGCAKEPLAPADAVEHTVRLTLNGSVAPYDAPEGTKAAAALSWTENERIYVRTATSSGPSTSMATYQADGTWSFTYYGSLTGIQSVHCVYIQNAVNAGRNEVSLNYNSVVYEDTAAKLAVDADGNVTLSTYLKPKAGRLSFRATGQEAVASVGLSGLAWYSSFELSDFSFKTTEANVADFPVGSQFYFYGFFSEESGRKMIVWNGTGEARLFFSRTFGEAVLRSGASGYLEVPTHSQYEGWALENPENLDAYVPIVFEDANFKAWLVPRFDTDGDGEISRLEGRRITRIENTNSDNVTSLKGIEYFPNLQVLTWTGMENWGDNGREITGQLTSVDASQNMQLQQLNVSRNHLTSISLPATSTLTSLSIDRNQFSSIDLSGCPNLKHLNVGVNQFTSLSLSNLSYLETFYCYENQITSLDVNGCTSLQTLNFGTNQVSSIDIAALSRLTRLDCYDNPLTEINLGNCPQLQSLQCFSCRFTSLDLSSCPQLDFLHCESNQLTSLDVGNCTMLRTLYCSNNQILTLDLSGLSSLERCSMWNCQTETLIVNGCTSLTDLNCDENSLKSLDVSGLTALQDLSCFDNQLSSLDMSGCASLRVLNCYQNQLTALDVSGMASLEELRCQNNALTTLILSGNTKLNYLDFSTNRIAELNLNACQALQEIHGGWNPFSTTDLSALSALKYLYFESNQLTGLNLYANDALTYLNTQGSSQLATVTVKTGHTFPDGLYVDGTTEIVYQD